MASSTGRYGVTLSGRNDPVHLKSGISGTRPRPLHRKKKSLHIRNHRTRERRPGAGHKQPQILGLYPFPNTHRFVTYKGISAVCLILCSDHTLLKHSWLQKLDSARSIPSSRHLGHCSVDGLPHLLHGWVDMLKVDYVSTSPPPSSPSCPSTSPSS